MKRSLISLMQWFAEREERAERRREAREGKSVFTMDKSQLPHYLKTMTAWEAEIAAKDGNLDLGNKERLRTLTQAEQESSFGRFTRVFSKNGLTQIKALQEIISRYSGLPEAISLEVSSPEELQQHLRRIHAISYAHYVFGANKNPLGTFPARCCNISARNVLLAQLEQGYPMATFAENSTHSHSYNVIPFVLNQSRKGAIISDPTSDQLWPSLEENQPRNLTFVVEGDRWRYLTEWAPGKNLYPDGLITLAQLKKMANGRFYEIATKWGLKGANIYADAKREQEPRDYLKRAFENPVKVAI